MFPLRPSSKLHARKQQGAALMLMLVILVLGAATVLVSSLNSSRLKMERDKITADALAQAKEALIGYAVKVKINNSNALDQWRPGDLPCPDRDNDGDTDAGPCGNAVGSNPGSRLGRLPWKTLGIPDLRDSSGERLWYAVSNNFKNSERAAIPLNSDTPGTITVRNQDGSILHDASTQNGVVAVLFAPGAVLMRTDQAAPQDRSIAGVNNALNYLDIANGEDNAGFVDGAQNGFIQGSIKDVNGNILLNDQLLAITQDDLMRPVQMRVAGEVRQCLIEYALTNNLRYPWAVPLDDLEDFKDKDNLNFGRIPDNLNQTGGGTGMNKKWGINCNTHDEDIASTWWKNWREIVFYAVAKDYKPDDVNPDAITCEAANECLSVTPPPAAVGNKKFVVIVAGKKLAGQQRSTPEEKKDITKYLEGENAVTPLSFEQKLPSTSFNDVVVFE